MVDVSVLMCVHNGEAYLKEAIDSILGQTFSNFEFIIINDGSTDNSLQIINAYTDKRIRLISNKHNLGLTKSLNKGIGLALGKYIARIDADDVAMATRLQKQYDYMEKDKDVALVGSMYKLIGDKSLTSNVPLTNDAIKLLLLRQNALAHPSAFIRKSILDEKNLRYNEAFTVAQDYELWSRIMEYGKIENLPDVLLEYRRHDGQVSTLQLRKQTEAANAVRLTQLKRLVSFEGKPYIEDFILRVIQKEAFGVTSDDMAALSMFMEDSWNTNRVKHIYNKELFKEFLHIIWAYYLSKLSGYKFSNYSVIANDQYGFKKNPMGFTLKYWVGSIWGLRQKLK